jgi:hypothetical protein
LILAIGITFEIYQELGKEEVVRIVLKLWVIHPRIEGRISLTNLRGIQSRPMAIDFTPNNV